MGVVHLFQPAAAHRGRLFQQGTSCASALIRWYCTLQKRNAHFRKRSPLASTRSRRRWGKLRHAPRTSQEALMSATSACNRVSNSAGVSFQDRRSWAADLTSLDRNQEITVSCGRTSAISPGWAWGPSVESKPAQRRKPSQHITTQRHADATQTLTRRTHGHATRHHAIQHNLTTARHPSPGEEVIRWDRTEAARRMRTCYPASCYARVREFARSRRVTRRCTTPLGLLQETPAGL